MVKFPTGGDEASELLSPRASFGAGFGVNPKPTVKSGWEKMEVAVRSKMQVLDAYSSMPIILPQSQSLGVFIWQIWGKPFFDMG